jgi:ferredoxin-thioredoxin reductase catalytic chain
VASRLADPEAARAYARQVAQHRGWVVNADAALVDTVVAGLAAQAGRLGKAYCPCRDVDGTPTEADLVCPCAYAQADIDEFGQCFCGLYLSNGKDPRTVSSIPERRP